MSSNILSQPIDVKKFGLVYAGAQKNAGASGIAIVIIREDLIKKSIPYTPILYQYSSYSKTKSLPNTPPTFNWYLCSLIFKWLKRQGGLASMKKINETKASLLYKTIDESNFYSSSIPTTWRSKMNVVFNLISSDLEKTFIMEAKQRGLIGLAGHRSKGGIRASLYNAMPIEGVEILTNFMQEFEQKHG